MSFYTEKYQLVSDIHLEFLDSNFPDIKKESPTLILAGDIGVISDVKLLISFIKQCCSKWTNVFFVMGNHEYYDCNDMDITLNRLRRKTIKIENFHILNNDYFILDNVAIYGFTAWTIPSDKIRRNKDKLCDFSNIKINGRSLTIDDMDSIAKSDIAKFKEFINKVNSNEIECKAVIVITHFPPVRIGTSDPKYLGDDLNDYFSWNNMLVSEEIVCNKIKVWCSGHTHWSYDFIIDDIRFISNQCGYPFEFLPHSNGYFEVKVDA